MGHRRALLALLSVLLILFGAVNVLADGENIEPLVQEGTSIDRVSAVF